MSIKTFVFSGSSEALSLTNSTSNSDFICVKTCCSGFPILELASKPRLSIILIFGFFVCANSAINLVKSYSKNGSLSGEKTLIFFWPVVEFVAASPKYSGSLLFDPPKGLIPIPTALSS